ncbi:MAG: hypothetical protein WEE89_03910 [Gemmatimonadota bacterium]
MWKKSGWIGAAIAFLASPVANAQRIVPDPVSCPRCTIEARTVLRIGGLDSPLPSEGPADVVADGQGRYWVFSWNATPMVFDRTGKPIREFTHGAGPNETGFAEYAILTPADSVAIFDAENRRISVFASDLTAKRSIALSGFPVKPRILRWPDRVIVVQPAGSRQTLQPPLQLIDLSGPTSSTLATFGRIRTTLTGPALARSFHRTLSSVRNGRVWEAEHMRYNLHYWRVDGTFPVLLDSLQRRPAWFSEELVSPGVPVAHPRLNRVEQDADGLVWVFLNQPTGVTLSEVMPKRSSRTREGRTDQIPMEKLLRTVVEVIDPKTARVITRTTVPSILSTVLADGRAVFYNVDRDGIPYLEIVTLRLAGR